MAGEIFYMVSAARAKELKQKPEKIWDFDRDKIGHLDLDVAGYQIDVALDLLGDQLGERCLQVAVGGGKQIGNDDCTIRHLPATTVKKIAGVLAKIELESFRQSLSVGCNAPPEVEAICVPLFEALVNFFKHAAQKKQAVVKTIY